MAFKCKKVPVELKLMVPVELKSFGWPLGIEDHKCKCKKVSRTKMVLNFSGTKIQTELKIAAELTFWGDP